MNPDIELLDSLKKNIYKMNHEQLEIIFKELLKLADALEPNYEEIILLFLENLSENS